LFLAVGKDSTPRTLDSARTGSSRQSVLSGAPSEEWDAAHGPTSRDVHFKFDVRDHLYSWRHTSDHTQVANAADSHDDVVCLVIK
jgi:hypothetical protein